MAIYTVPEKYQKVWDEWNIRGAILFSLWLQIVLTFLSPMRKRRKGLFVGAIIWLTYLTADIVAAYAVGLISSSQGSEGCNKAVTNDALLAFWAPFLLLHLGGPDSITAFSLEDNQLWIRHLLTLITQVVLVCYVFFQSFPNELWLPSVLMFVAGCIKYGERTYALYSASGNVLLYPDRREIYDVRSIEKRFDVSYKYFSSNNYYEKEKGIVSFGYLYYKGFGERGFDRLSIRISNAEDGFKILESQLNFLYDKHFTKMATMHSSGWRGYVVRFTSTTLIAISILLFELSVQKHNNVNKNNIHHLDLVVTYALVVGAIVLEFVGLLKVLFSDWTIAILERLNQEKTDRFNYVCIFREVILRCIIWIKYRLVHPQLRRRWCSRKVPQYNFISYCSRRHFKWLEDKLKYFGMEIILQEWWYKDISKPVTKELQEFIYHRLLPEYHDRDIKNVMEFTTDKLGPLAVGRNSVSGDRLVIQRVLEWHIATDLLYYNDKNTSSSTSHAQDYREISKILSDYMLYLLVMKPTLFTEMDSKETFDKACFDAIKLFHGERSSSKLLRPTEACETLIDIDPRIRSLNSNILQNSLVVFRSIRELFVNNSASIHTDDMWKMISRVWLKMLCSSVIQHNRGVAVYTQELAKGGELITFVWLILRAQ